MHKISDEFEFRSDRTTDYGVSYPWVSKKFPIDLQWENGVCMLAHSFLIKSSSKLLVIRTGIKARMSLISGLWFPWPIYMFLKWDLTLAHWTQVSDRCPLGYLFFFVYTWVRKKKKVYLEAFTLGDEFLDSEEYYFTLLCSKFWISRKWQVKWRLADNWDRVEQFSFEIVVVVAYE